jgi:hypothetical protein
VQREVLTANPARRVTTNSRLLRWGLTVAVSGTMIVEALGLAIVLMGVACVLAVLNLFSWSNSRAA